MIQISNVSYKAQNKTIISDVSFRINKGDVFALIGKNGSGKSTLIDVMMGDIAPYVGKVEIKGVAPKKIGVLYDHLPLLSSLRVIEMLKYYCTLYQIKYQDVAEKYFDDFEMKDIEKSFIRTLSLGEKKRVSILLTLLCEPELLILDEPFANIDPTITERIWNHLKNNDRSIFFTTHNWADASKRANKVAFMVNGSLSGEPMHPQKALESLPASKKIIFEHSVQLEEALSKQAYYVHDGNMICFFDNDPLLMETLAQYTSNFSIQDIDLTDVYLYQQKMNSYD